MRPPEMISSDGYAEARQPTVIASGKLSCQGSGLSEGPGSNPGRGTQTFAFLAACPAR